VQHVTKYHNKFPALLHSVSTCAVSLKNIAKQKKCT